MQMTDQNTFVVYHVSTTMQVGPVPGCSDVASSTYRKLYSQAGFARRACDKFNAKPRMVTLWGNKLSPTIGVPGAITQEEMHGPGNYGWCSLEHYRTRVVRMVERTNFMSGQKFVEPSNTPHFCSPSSETYWSM